MKTNHVLENLCWRDPRHPMYVEIYGQDEIVPTPRVNCSCDNCFYGRDALALELLQTKQQIKALMHTKKVKP